MLIDLGGSQLDVIPTVGFSNLVLSYFSALRLSFDSLPMLKYKREKTKRGLFKMATLRRWMPVVLASSPELVEGIRKASDDVLSMNTASIESRMPPGILCPFS